jgi:hypothetical protein
MRVFISWSGETSRDVALALRDWLPGVINSVRPFVSTKDIYAGSRWQMEIAAQLEATNFGIVCVTRANQSAPWLNFEAGALAKAVESSSVVPLAIGLKPSDIQLPLAQFQAQPASQAGVAEILTAINGACSAPLSDDLLGRALQKWWPELDSVLKRILEASKETVPQGPSRTDRELLEEMLDTVRSLARGPRAVGGSKAPMIPADHPLVGEIASLLAGEPPGWRVMHRRTGRMLGIRPTRELPEGLRREIVERAAIYDVDIDFLPLGTASEPSWNSPPEALPNDEPMPA